MSQLERRQQQRHAILLPIQVKLVKQPLIDSEEYLCNISGAGLAFISEQRWQIGSLLEVQMMVGDEMFIIETEVLRCEPFEAENCELDMTLFQEFFIVGTHFTNLVLDEHGPLLQKLQQENFHKDVVCSMWW